MWKWASFLQCSSNVFEDLGGLEDPKTFFDRLF